MLTSAKQQKFKEQRRSTDFCPQGQPSMEQEKNSGAKSIRITAITVWKRECSKQSRPFRTQQRSPRKTQVNPTLTRPTPTIASDHAENPCEYSCQTERTPEDANAARSSWIPNY